MLTKYNMDKEYVSMHIEEGKEFMGVSCENCHVKVNMLRPQKYFRCECGAYNILMDGHFTKPFFAPDFGPPASIIEFEGKFNKIFDDSLYMS